MSTIQPGALGVDYSAARIPASTLVAANVKFVCRYSSRNPNQKNLDGNETADLLPAGIGISLNHEQTQGGMLGSPAEVVDMARVAVSNARAHGYPPGVPISFSHDLAPAGGDRTLLMSNYRLVTSVLADAGYPCGAYGGLDFIDWLDQEGLCPDLRWQSYAWSTQNGPRLGTAAYRNRQALEQAAARYPNWAAVLSPNETGVAIVYHPTSHVFQQYGRVNVPISAVPQSIDENVCLRPFVVWHASTIPAPIPAQEDDAMHVIVFNAHPDLGIAAGDKFNRASGGRARNGYEDNPDLAARIAAGGTIAEDEINAVDQYAVPFYISKEYLAYQRGLEPSAASAAVDMAAVTAAANTGAKTGATTAVSPIVADVAAIRSHFR